MQNYAGGIMTSPSALLLLLVVVTRA